MHTRFPLTLLALSLALALPHATAEDGGVSEVELERAQQLIDRGQALRDQADARFRIEEYECYQRYFVNRCLDRARETRLEVVREARVLEIEGREIELAAQRERIEARNLPDTLGDYRPDPPPLSDITVLPTTEAEAAESLRAFREAERQRAEARAARERAERDVERDQRRAETEAEAARRAAQTERDRARYEERQRRYGVDN